MKKIISISLISVILILCLTVSALAAPKPNVSFNDDFTKMYYNNKSFSRINTKNIDYNYNYTEIPMDDYEYNDGVYSEIYDDTYEIFEVIPNKAHTNVDNIDVSSNDQFNIFFVTVDFNDGSTFTCSFLRDDYMTEFENMVSGKSQEYVVDFSWNEITEVKVDVQKLKTGKTTTIDYYYVTDFNVFAETKDKSFRYYAGLVMTVNDNFYYYDYLDAGTSHDEFWFGVNSYPEQITVRVIEDEEIIQQLRDAKKIYDDESGYIFDDDFAVGISKLFFGILLLLIPFAICIGSLVLFIKAKKPIYKKIFATICILSLLEIITVVLIIIFFNKYTNT